MKFLLSLLNNKEFKLYFNNTSWMISEKIVSMGLAIVVSIFVARYLGPEDFGILSYALSLSSLFSIATHMGLSGLAVRELVNRPNKQEELMGTIFGIKFAGAIIAILVFWSFIFFTTKSDTPEFWVLTIVSGTILLKPFEVFDFWFQANVLAKYSSIVRSISSIILSIVKILLVVLGSQLLFFAVAHLLEALLIIALFIFIFSRKSTLIIKGWKFKFLEASYLIKQGWMIMLGSIFSIIYLKIDQVMIKWMVNAEELGIYSVAVKLSESWYFIPTVIVASLFPKLLKLKSDNEIQYNHRLQQLFDFLFIIALLLAIFISFTSDTIVNLFYGQEYAKSSLILTIHIWAGIFIFMRAAFSKWILVEDAVSFSLITQGAGAVVNILLNFIFIPLYGGLGAAIATLVSYAMASYFSLLFYKKSRPIFWMMTKSLVFPYRYLVQYFKREI